LTYFALGGEKKGKDKSSCGKSFDQRAKEIYGVRGKRRKGKMQ